MEAKDVIHFYANCDFIVKDKNDEWLMDTANFMFSDTCEIWGTVMEGVPYNEAKLVLRRPLSITEKEFAEYNSLRHTRPNRPLEGKYMIGERDTACSLAWLINNKFDVYSLISKGAAIDEIDLKRMKVKKVSPIEY